MNRIMQSTPLRTIAGALTAVLVVGALAASIQAAEVEVSDGGLDWGVKSSFRNYVTGPIAEGDISTSGGASENSDGTFHFPVSGGEYDSETGELTVSFGGSVHFTGHDYGNGNLLDLEISDIRVELDGSSGTLIADVSSRSLESLDTEAELGPIETYSNVTLAELSGADADEDENEVSWSGIDAALGSGAVEAFAEFYTAGTALDPVSIELELEEAATATPTQTAASSPTATGTVLATPTSTPAAPTATPVQASDVESTAGIQAPAVGDAGLASGR